MYISCVVGLVPVPGSRGQTSLAQQRTFRVNKRQSHLPQMLLDMPKPCCYHQQKRTTSDVGCGVAGTNGSTRDFDLI